MQDRCLSPLTIQVISMPFGLVSQVSLIFCSTRSAKLSFFDPESHSSCCDCHLSRIKCCEEWKEGAYAQDKLNI